MNSSLDLKRPARSTHSLTQAVLHGTAFLPVYTEMLAVVVADVEGESEYQFERRQFMINSARDAALSGLETLLGRG